MTDEAAGPRRPAEATAPPAAEETTAEVGTSPAGPYQAGDLPAADPDAPAGSAGGGPPPGASPPPPAGPPPGATPPPGPPPPGGPPPPAGPPPPGGGYVPPRGTPFAQRYGLVRPRQGRYVAGVCAAIGRATNTDPVLWRVLLAVLGFFGGIGVLVYVAAWLIIPAEGDSASPIESMLGRGRSSMSPVTVIVLAVLVAVMFAFIVTDGFRSVLLGTAILIGGALLLNREAGRQRPVSTPGPAPAPGPEPATAFRTADVLAPDVPPGGAYATAPPSAFPPAAPGPAPHPAGEPAGPAPAGAADSPYSAGQLGPHAVPAAQPSYPTAYPTAPVSGSGAYPVPGPPVPPPSGPPGGYRPPFAPHGPYAPGAPYPPPAAPAPKPPKPPRERSALGAATFSMIFVVIGLVAMLDLTGAIPIGPSAYFAGVLVTTALGLLVGAWFGRARWLIAVGLAAALALGISTLAESSDMERLQGGSVLWRPTAVAELGNPYENSFGDATLDLTAVDFTAVDITAGGPEVTARVNFGRLVVIVPPEVDVTAVTDVNAGDATVFGQRWSGMQGAAREVTDLGPDGRGGGTLRLDLHVNAGELEVRR